MALGDRMSAAQWRRLVTDDRLDWLSSRITIVEQQLDVIKQAIEAVRLERRANEKRVKATLLEIELIKDMMVAAARLIEEGIRDEY